MSTTVEMWFDPKCPWAWNGSRWLLEVEQVRDIRVLFHTLSLSALNADREVEPWYREWLDAGWGPARICLAAERAHGAESLRELYTALGTHLHRKREPLGRELYVAALAEAGLPVELADAADDPGLDAGLVEANRAGLGPVGEDLGTPAIHVPGPDGLVAFFGPVVTPVPRGEAAGRLWDGVLLCAGTDGFFELKRSRTRRPREDEILPA
ncbi:mycothiol-dependent nitroreductase Rv2466c family protein [Actinocatenispora comari]|jgi:hypothetical protein|uniref:DSBA oxidoreductase n=1 Tax=Actinocatenispora comari TaxID=2807577 RepID=A0A8J4A813_9ACTN|nr:disulfide bond formation protein DsbA [Actinocatenispora comari]GIL25025.1 DSBA oxidoreductase [Actinocatenispora comari]